MFCLVAPALAKAIASDVCEKRALERQEKRDLEKESLSRFVGRVAADRD